MAAAAYKGTGTAARVMLAIEIEGRALPLGPSGVPAERLELTYVATDADGRARSIRAYDGPLALEGERSTHASRDGIRVVSWLDLPAGRYDVRVSARTGAAAGDAQLQLHVPDFAARLTMSGVSISAIARDPLTIAADEEPRLALPAAPTARREFRTGDTLMLFSEVYENEHRLQQGPASGRPSDPEFRPLGDHTIHVIAQLIADDGTILITQVGARSLHPGQQAGRHAFSTEVPLDGVPPGHYVLRLRARGNIGGPDTAAEDVPIRVR